MRLSANNASTVEAGTCCVCTIQDLGRTIVDILVIVKMTARIVIAIVVIVAELWFGQACRYPTLKHAAVEALHI